MIKYRKKARQNVRSIYISEDEYGGSESSGVGSKQGDGRSLKMNGKSQHLAPLEYEHQYESGYSPSLTPIFQIQLQKQALLPSRPLQMVGELCDRLARLLGAKPTFFQMTEHQADGTHQDE